MARKMTPEQVKHYLLSFDDSTLIRWYNDVVIEPFGDFSEQAIRDNIENSICDIENDLSFETLIAVAKNPKTVYRSEDKFVCITGCDKPYIVSFSTFEEFLKVADGDELCKFLSEQEDDLETLESVARNRKK